MKLSFPILCLPVEGAHCDCYYTWIFWDFVFYLQFSSYSLACSSLQLPILTLCLSVYCPGISHFLLNSYSLFITLVIHCSVPTSNSYGSLADSWKILILIIGLHVYSHQHKFIPSHFKNVSLEQCEPRIIKWDALYDFMVALLEEKNLPAPIVKY